jgi:hypothetical protein
MLIYLSKHPHAFDPEIITLLSGALDTAWETVRASGAQFNGDTEKARDLLAKHIVELALQGERDRQRLIDGALIRFKPYQLAASFV